MGTGIIGYLIFIGVIYVLQYILQIFLASIGLGSTAIFIIIELIISVLFAYLMIMKIAVDPRPMEAKKICNMYCNT